MKRMRYRPSRGMCLFSGCFGLIFVAIGLFVVIPTFGAFGILWTLVAVGITVYYFAMAAGKVSLGAYEVEDDGQTAPPPAGQDPETRLQELRRLYDRSLITEEEYETKRQEILKDL